MDENQDLKNPLIIPDEESVGAAEIHEQPTEVCLVRNLDNIDLSTILVPVADLDSVPKMLLEVDKEPEENNIGENAKSMRTSKIVEKPDLSLLYQDIIMNKVFQKQFTMSGHADFVTSKKYEDEESEDNIKVFRTLVHHKAEHLIYISTYKETKNTSSNEIQVIRELPDFEFDYFEFTPDNNYIIIGNREMVLL